MTNAILLYTGNVGSTPTIEYVRSSGKVIVPIIEHFDQYYLEKQIDNTKRLFPFLNEVLEMFYSGKLHPYLVKNDLAQRNKGLDLKSAPHTLFKWRPLPEDMTGSNEFLNLMQEHSVRPLVIRRKSIIDQAIKIHLSEKIYGSRHQQFKAGKMAESEYKVYLDEQEKIRVKIDEEGLKEVIVIANQFLQRTRRLIERRNALFPRDPRGDFVIQTEEIYTPLIEKKKFNELFSAVFSDTIIVRADSQLLTRKAGLEVSNCENYAEIAGDQRLKNIEEAYENIKWLR